MHDFYGMCFKKHDVNLYIDLALKQTTNINMHDVILVPRLTTNTLIYIMC